MAKVIIEGWREGLRKVSLTKLQREILELSLKDAKANTDALLENKKITFEIKDESVAEQFIHEAEKIGANCSIQV